LDTLQPTVDLSQWIGREEVKEERLDPFAARAFAALLDRDPDAFGEGAVLPAGWHWLYFKPVVRRSETGPDGHPHRGGFLPPIELPRRMWAGGSLTFSGPVLLGEWARRSSTIESVEEKDGRTGRLVFVNVRHRIETERGHAVDEVQNLVFRGASSGAAGEGPPPPGTAAWSDAYAADAVTLFRFSALTFNGHRIHYDQPYATGEEGYPGLVVHGPLLALLLMDAASRHGGRAPARFAYRALSPLFADEPFRIEGTEPFPPDTAGDGEVWVAGPRGTAMRAMAGWDGA